MKFWKLVPVIFVLAVVAAIPMSAWGNGPAIEKDGGMKKAIKDVLVEHAPRLMSLQGVSGTAEGVCNGSPCLKVYVVKKTPELLVKIPPEIEGYPVEIEETGEFKAR